MRTIIELEPDILMFRGESYESVATAFLAGQNVLLIDCLASRKDAEWMRSTIEDERGLHVTLIVMSHYMNDHMAGLPLFPEAQVVAQRNYMFTYLLRSGRTAEDFASFVGPDYVIEANARLTWGRYELDLFHNPGKTQCSLNVDVAKADLLFAADNMLGNIAYLSSSSSESLAAAIERLKQRKRTRIVSGHCGVFSREHLDRAAFYLEALGSRVRALRHASDEADLAALIEGISIEDCIAADATPSAFEREWHRFNLAIIKERQLFTIGQQSPVLLRGDEPHRVSRAGHIGPTAPTPS